MSFVAAAAADVVVAAGTTDDDDDDDRVVVDVGGVDHDIEMCCSLFFTFAPAKPVVGADDVSGGIREVAVAVAVPSSSE